MPKILFVGDIVGSGGRAAVRRLVPGLLAEYGCSFCIANGENMASGNGFSRGPLNELGDSGIDVFTGGDHMWDQKDFEKDILDFPNVLRPANVPPEQPGRGWGVFQDRLGNSIGVVSLLGRSFMKTPCDCPFRTAEAALAELAGLTRFIVVDFHAEATSDKIALGRFLDGRVSAVIGTHTHVPTADETVFPGGTAFQCDAGMVGARESVLGRDMDMVVRKYLTGMPVRFPVVNEGVRLNATVVSIGDDGRALSIERVTRD